MTASFMKGAGYREWRPRRVVGGFLNRLSRRRIRRAHRIIIGAGDTRFKGWCPTEVHELDVLDPESFAQYWSRGSRRAFLAEHVWEHLSLENGMLAARHCFDYLQPGGYLRLAVPDGLHPDATYIADVSPGGTGAGADDHKVLYTFESMRQMLTSVGYQVRGLEYWDVDGKFNAVEWVWSDGPVGRSLKHDSRNAGGELNYTSLIVDAIKDR